MPRDLALIGICVCLFTLMGCETSHAFGLECPRQSLGSMIPSRVRSLEGRLIYHDGIRQWFELKLDKSQCGEASIELIHAPETLRGCRVKSTGSIDFSPTGYYSLEEFQDVDRIEPIGFCSRQPPLPDYSKAKPDSSIRAYRVDMHVIYGPGDHPIQFRIRSGNKELRPWQAYASYMLTGGFVLYGKCGIGFVTDQVFGDEEGRPSHFSEPRTSDDMAAFDPESAAASGKRDLHLGYTCVRK